MIPKRILTVQGLRAISANAVANPDGYLDRREAIGENGKLTFLTFTQIDFSHSIFHDCTFTSVIFDACALSSVRFVNCTFVGCTFDGCAMDNVEFDSCSVQAEIKTSSAQRMRVINSDFVGSIYSSLIRNAQFSESDIDVGISKCLHAHFLTFRSVSGTLMVAESAVNSLTVQDSELDGSFTDTQWSKANICDSSFMLSLLSCDAESVSVLESDIGKLSNCHITDSALQNSKVGACSFSTFERVHWDNVEHTGRMNKCRFLDSGVVDFDIKAEHTKCDYTGTSIPKSLHVKNPLNLASYSDIILGEVPV